MTIYESKTNKYRIRKETRLNGQEWFYPEKRETRSITWFYHWYGNTGYRTFDDALRHVTSEIIEDNNDFDNKCIVSSEIL